MVRGYMTVTGRYLTDMLTGPPEYLLSSMSLKRAIGYWIEDGCPAKTLYRDGKAFYVADHPKQSTHTEVLPLTAEDISHQTTCYHPEHWDVFPPVCADGQLSLAVSIVSWVMHEEGDIMSDEYIAACDCIGCTVPIDGYIEFPS